MKKSLAAVTIIAVIALFWVILSRYITLADVQRMGRMSSALVQKKPLLVFFALVLAQGVGMALSLPSKALLTLLSGALLGPFVGTLACLIGVSFGTTLLFFAARYLLRDRVKARLGDRLEVIERRLGRHPIRALIGLRLFITIPYGPITLAAALTSMRYRHFLQGSVAGDIPVTFIYCLAGRQLFTLASVSEAISPWTVVTLVVAGLFVLATALLGKPRQADR